MPQHCRISFSKFILPKTNDFKKGIMSLHFMKDLERFIERRAISNRAEDERNIEIAIFLWVTSCIGTKKVRLPDVVSLLQFAEEIPHLFHYFILRESH